MSIVYFSEIQADKVYSVDTQDETTTDRRRTQVRLAQRAYRNRKETYISVLEKRVGELEKTIQTMNNAYTQLHDNIIRPGLFNPRSNLSSQLKSTAELFATPVKLVQDSDDHDHDHEHDHYRNRTASVDIIPEHTSSSGIVRKKSNLSPQESAHDTSEYKMAYLNKQCNNDLDTQVSDLQMFKAPNFEDNVQQDFQQWNVQIPDTQLDVDLFFSTIEKPLKATQ